MYNMSTRMNQITFFTGLVLLVCSGVNLAIGQYFQKGKPEIAFEVLKVRKLSENIYKKWDECWLNFKISADLNNYLDWNTKFVYLYVNVQFTDKDGKYKSENIIWDSHVQRQLQPTFFDIPLQQYYAKVNMPVQSVNLTDQRHEYALRDVHNSLMGQTVTFQVWAETTPIIGNIYKEKLYEVPYTLPSKKV